jgi:hypothetical protein
MRSCMKDFINVVDWMCYTWTLPIAIQSIRFLLKKK